MKNTLNWARAAGVCALKTFIQTAFAMIVVGAILKDIQWMPIVYVSLIAGILSVLVTNLPEMATDGSLLIDTSDPFTDRYRLAVDIPLGDLKSKSVLKLTIIQDADLSQIEKL